MLLLVQFTTDQTGAGSGRMAQAALHAAGHDSNLIGLQYMYVVTIVRSHFANFEFTVSGGTWPGDLKSHHSKTVRRLHTGTFDKFYYFCF